MAEIEFMRIVPFAINNNQIKFQAKVDFDVGVFKVDVKASKLNQGSRNYPAKRWAFSIKKQEFCADFIVCFGIVDEGYTIFLIPGECVRKYQTVSIAPLGKSKWLDFKITPSELLDFFRELTGINT